MNSVHFSLTNGFLIVVVLTAIFALVAEASADTPAITVP